MPELRIARILLAFLFGTALIVPQRVVACECIATGPACSEYARYAVVFSGIVTSIAGEDNPPQINSYRQTMRRVHFGLLENLRGAETSDIEILTGMGGGDCGYPFRVGESYLVYAYAWQGRLTTGICSRTRLLSNAKEDLDYIHSLATAPPGASVFGSLMRLFPPEQGASRREPLGGIKVVVASTTGEIHTATSGPDGRFLVEGLEAGKYTVAPQFPDSLTLRDSRARQIVLVEHGCAQENFYAIANGRISGRVLNADSTPAAQVPVLLVPAGDAQAPAAYSSYMHTQANGDGHFEFKGVAPGEYVLGVSLLNPPSELAPFPKTFYPGVDRFDGATHLKLGEAGQISNLQFQLPPKLTATKLSILVVWPDGRRVAGAEVVVNDTEFNGPPWSWHADNDGRAEAPVFEGRTYSLWVSSGGSDQQRVCTTRTNLTIGRNPEPIRIQLDPEAKCK